MDDERVFNRDTQSEWLVVYFEKHKSIRAANEAVGVSYGEYCRWRKDPWFLERLGEVNELYLNELRSKAYELAMTVPDGRFLLEIIQRDDPGWDKELRRIQFEANLKLPDFSGVLDGQKAVDPLALEDESGKGE